MIQIYQQEMKAIVLASVCGIGVAAGQDVFRSDPPSLGGVLFPHLHANAAMGDRKVRVTTDCAFNSFSKAWITGKALRLAATTRDSLMPFWSGCASTGALSTSSESSGC